MRGARRLQRGVLDGTDDPPLIAADRLTVPALLRQHGYTTAAIGKWHLGFDCQRPADAKTEERKKLARGEQRQAASRGLPVGSRIIAGPVTRGFDYFWGCSNARTMSGLMENDRVIENIEPITMLPRLGQRAVSYVAERSADAKAGKPFFLYLPLTSPHTPILPTPQWQGKSGLGAYGDFVMQTDAVVGDVLAALEKHGLADNTLVVFTADNGCSPAAGTDKLEQQGHFASASFRGYKADIWDGGHRVPFFVRWPGKVKPGTQSTQLICHTDLMATCAEILGAKLPDTAAEDSVSILPALLGQDRSPLREAVVHHSIHGRFAIRQGPWKLELCPGSGGWGKPGDNDAQKQGLPDVQLYDLSADTGRNQERPGRAPRSCRPSHETAGAIRRQRPQHRRRFAAQRRGSPLASAGKSRPKEGTPGREGKTNLKRRCWNGSRIQSPSASGEKTEKVRGRTVASGAARDQNSGRFRGLPSYTQWEACFCDRSLYVATFHLFRRPAFWL